MTSFDIDNEGEAAGGEARGRLDVLLVYEDFGTGLRARRAFEQVARQLELEADFNVDLWKLDLLHEPALLELVANEAAKAHIVFLSAHGQGELPGTANLWLQQWLERRGGEPCALVVLLDRPAGDTAAANQTLEALRATALAAGVEVFLPAAEALHTERQSALDENHPHPETRAGRPGEIVRRLELHPYRDWGINE